MVIQRNWKIVSSTTDNCQHPNNNNTPSSNDSNSSWKTNSTAPKSSGASATTMGGNSLNTVTTVTATVKSHISNSQMAESVHRALRNRLNGRSHATETDDEAAVRSMELMRTNVQEVFNQEIHEIVTKYIENFFKPALTNINENLSDSCISDDIIPKISCTLLDNAKARYGFQKATPSAPTIIKTEPIFDAPESITKPSAFKRKLLPDDSSSTISVHRLDGALSLKVNPINRTTTFSRTKQVYWNVSQLNADTRFVLDFKANRALGFSDTSKERLASKHPELIRYLPDTVDKDWMFQQQIISAANKYNRFLLLVHGEVLKVARSEAYKSTAKFNNLDSFRIPDFMLQKMKIFFTELSLRSQSFVGSQYQPVQSTATVHQQTSCGVLTNASGNSTNNNSTSSMSNMTGHFSGKCQTNTTSVMMSNNMPKSSLSKSHATLSALLAGGMASGRSPPGKSSNSSIKLLGMLPGKEVGSSAGISAASIKKEIL